MHLVLERMPVSPELNLDGGEKMDRAIIVLELLMNRHDLNLHGSIDQS